MKRIGKKILANSVLILALLLILSGGMGYLLISQEPKIDDLISQNQKEFAGNTIRRQEKIKNAEYDGEVTHVEGAAIAEARENYNSSIEEYGIGTVYIPASEISLPLLAGTSEWNLLNGVATASADQELGKGLFVGISHNLVNQRLLQNIDQAEENDLVYLTDFQDVYTYQISEQTVVHETESSYLKEPEANEEAKLLLYRCEGEFNTDWRRIIYGDYIKKEKFREVDEEILNGLMIDFEAQEETPKEILQNQQRNKNSQNIFQRLKTKIIDFISQIDFLFHLFLRIYGFADSHMILFFIFVLLLFIIYYLL